LPQFETLIKAVRTALPLGKLFTVAVDDSSMNAWNGQLANEVFDYVFAMTYWKKRWDYIEWFLNSGITAQKLLIGLCTEDKETPEEYIQYVISHGLRGLFAWRVDTDESCNGVHAIKHCCEAAL
jgi:GH18 family chitinase